MPEAMIFRRLCSSVFGTGRSGSAFAGWEHGAIHGGVDRLAVRRLVVRVVGSRRFRDCGWSFASLA
jgi:hypothetical protein